MENDQIKLIEEVLKETLKVEYKDSEEARFEEEKWDPDEDVIVKDRFKNGKAITFVWERKKSNGNIKNVGQGKAGFTFYHARHIYRDPYLIKTSVKTSKLNGLSVVGTVAKNDKKAILVVQEIIEGKDEEGDPKIRIFSATYANKKAQLAYFIRAFEMARKTSERNSGGLERLEESTCNDDFIKLTTMRHRRKL